MMRASSSSSVKSGFIAVAILWAAAGLTGGTARAQYQNPGSPSELEAPTPGTSPDRPRFAVDATLQMGETGRPTVRLDYRMSRSELLFERTPPAGYHAAYEVRVIFFRDKGGRQVTGDTAYKIFYKVMSETGEQLLAADTTLARHEGKTSFLIRPRLVSIGPGTYRFTVALNVPPKPGSKEKTSTIRRDKDFEVDQSRATMGFASAQSVDVLRYVATQQEIDEIGKLQGEDARKAYWDAFWKRRDPTPETPENEARDAFYQRVQYANQHFATGGPGWKTDMGHIYIVYGRPDEVVRNPFNFDRPPEEIWYYYRDRRTFVFVDRDGFGRYEQVYTPSSP